MWNDIHCTKEKLFDMAISTSYISGGELQPARPGRITPTAGEKSKAVDRGGGNRRNVKQKLIEAANGLT